MVELGEHIFRLDREEILYFNDTTVWGSGKEGMILTEDRMYWNMYDAVPRNGELEYELISGVDLYKDFMNFNGGSPSIPLHSLREKTVAVFKLMRDIAKAVQERLDREERAIREEMKRPTKRPKVRKVVADVDRSVAGGSIHRQDAVINRARLDLPIPSSAASAQGRGRGPGPGVPCPHCKQKLEYIPKYDGWYCWNCDSYPFRE